MAGLGSDVKTQFLVRSRMNGFTTLGGVPVSLWYFDSDGSGSGFMSDRFMPSAHLETIEGQPVALQFLNASPMPHTIHLHGLDVDQANDGVPQTSGEVPSGQSFTYHFTAPHAGTYHYHCHVDTVVHYHRGMSGAIIVRPPDGALDRAWTGGPTFDEEVLWQLGTFDTTWAAINESGPATARIHPDVFMINGKVTADAMTDPFTRIACAPGDTIYLRLLNNAYQAARVSLGGRAFQVVASDGRPMRTWINATSWEILPGERYDLLLENATPGTDVARVEYLDDYTGAVLGAAETVVEIA